MAADDEEIVKVKLELDEGSVEADAAKAGKQIKDAVETNAKPKITPEIVLPKNMADTGRRLLQGMEVEKTLGSMLSGVKFDTTELGKQLSVSRGVEDALTQLFGRSLGKAITTVPGAAGRAGAPGLPSPVSQEDATKALLQRLQPIMAGAEGVAAALSTLTRTGSLTTAAALATQPFFGLVGRGPRRETAEEAIERRLAGGPRLGGPPGPGEVREVEPFAGRGSGVLGGVGRAIGRASVAGAAADTLGLHPLAVGGAGAGAVVGGLIGGPPGAIAGGVGGALLGQTIGVVGGAVIDAAKHIEDLGVKGATTSKQLFGLAGTMNVPIEKLLLMQRHAARAGVHFTDLQSSIQRMAVRAQIELPEVEKKVADSADVMEEAAIKERQANRAVEKSHDDRVAATDRVRKAQGELTKFDLTRAQEREQQARGADLAVSGAQIGLRGAQMQQIQAALGLRYAPQEAALADIRGKETVAGARLGLEQAGIGAEEARLRYRQQVLGEEPDPDRMEALAKRRARAQLDAAEHNERTAKLSLEEAKLAEDRRQATIAAGIGPEAQAQQQYLAAGQAQAQAALALDQAQVARTKLETDQTTTSLEQERAELLRQSNQAERDRLESIEVTPEIVARRAARARGETKYGEIPEVIRAMEAFERGEPLEDFQFKKIQGQALRGALFQRAISPETGEINVNQVLEELSTFLRGPLAGDKNAQLRAIQEVFPGRRGNLEAAKEMRDFLLLSPEDKAKRETPEELRDVQKLADFMTSRREAGAELLSQQSLRELNESMNEMVTGLKSIDLAKDISSVGETLKSGGEATKQFFIDGATSVEQFLKSGGQSAFDAMKSGGEAAGNALLAILSSFQPSAPAGAVTATEEQSGGYITGPGSETSDSIPARLSRGEFVIRASSVRKAGVPFLNALNEGRFAAGGVAGVIADAEQQRLMRELGIPSQEDFLAMQRLQIGLGFQRGGNVDFERLRDKRAAEERAKQLADERLHRERTMFNLDILQRLKSMGFIPDPKKDGKGGKPTTGGGARTTASGGDLPASGPGGSSFVPEPGISQYYPFVRPAPKFVQAPQFDSATGLPTNREAMLQQLATLKSPRRFGGESGRVKVIEAPTKPGEFGRVVTPGALAAQDKALGLGQGPKITGLSPTVTQTAQTGPGGSKIITVTPTLRPADLEPLLPPETPPVAPTVASTEPPLVVVPPTPTEDVPLPRPRPEIEEPPPPDIRPPKFLDPVPQYERRPVPGLDQAGIDLYAKQREEEERRRAETDAAGGLVGSLVRGFAGGGLAGGFAMAANAQGYSGSMTSQQSSPSASVMSFHQLDLRTNAGNIPVAVSQETMEGLRRSSLGGKLSQTGPRPTWYS